MAGREEAEHHVVGPQVARTVWVSSRATSSAAMSANCTPCSAIAMASDLATAERRRRVVICGMRRSTPTHRLMCSLSRGPVPLAEGSWMPMPRRRNSVSSRMGTPGSEIG